MDEKTRTLLAEQDGTISRSQLLGLGHAPHVLERMLRRRELVRLLPAAFVDHTGDPTWSQRAWAGVHHFGTAALDADSALRAAVGPTWRHHDPADPIRIVLPAHLRRRPVPGYHVRRCRAYDRVILTNTSPPRMRLEHAALVAASRRDDLGAVQLLADACQSRRTTASRLLAAAGELAQLPRRTWLIDVLRDVADGTCSVLEHGYLDRVERPHGLPVGTRQRAVHGGRRDVEYLGQAQVVELDGRLFHDSAKQRDADLDRDLVAAVDRQHAVRLGWGQVYDRSCATAGRVGALLTHRGWAGPVVACSPDCPAPQLWRS